MMMRESQVTNSATHYAVLVAVLAPLCSCSVLVLSPRAWLAGLSYAVQFVSLESRIVSRAMARAMALLAVSRGTSKFARGTQLAGL